MKNLLIGFDSCWYRLLHGRAWNRSDEALMTMQMAELKTWIMERFNLIDNQASSLEGFLK